MTPVDINRKLRHLDTWRLHATPAHRRAFCVEMEPRQFGAAETVDAWLWFFAGWLASETERHNN